MTPPLADAWTHELLQHARTCEPCDWALHWPQHARPFCPDGATIWSALVRTHRGVLDGRRG